jgi:hypothetical protein
MIPITVRFFGVKGSGSTAKEAADALPHLLQELDGPKAMSTSTTETESQQWVFCTKQNEKIIRLCVGRSGLILNGQIALGAAYVEQWNTRHRVATNSTDVLPQPYVLVPTA